MTPWKCAGCGCEYQWNEPHKKHGAMFCDTCVDDPEAIKRVSVGLRAGSGWWFAFGIILGVILAKILFCSR